MLQDFENNTSRTRSGFPFPLNDEKPTPQKDGSLSPSQLERFLADQYCEPNWRAEAEIDTAYYDGDQLKKETIERMIENGILPAIVNFCAPAIDSVAGLEVVTRQDLRCVSVDDDSYEIAMAMNQKFKEAMRVTGFARKVGIQFKRAINMGISWLEVSRSDDPFGYPYRVLNVPWREMFMDYRAREANYDDGRYMIRRKWFDEDDLLSYFPEKKHQRMIRSAAKANGEVGKDDWLSRFENNFYNFPHALDLSMHRYAEPRWNLQEDEWQNNTRQRVGVTEILYWVPGRVEALELMTGHVVKLDLESPAQLQLLQQGQARYREGRTRTWRQAIYIGSERMSDIPLNANMPHYIPMVAYRKDNTGEPYGLTRRMRSPQDSYNSRNTRVQWDTVNRTYLIDEDAVDDAAGAAKQLNKSVSAIPLKSDRRSEEGIRKMINTETSPITLQLLAEAKMNIYEVTGLYPEFMGQVQSAGQSGVAIDQLIEQSSKVLGAPFDNYKNAKMQAGKMLFTMLAHDFMNRQNETVDVQGDGGKNKKVVLNALDREGNMNNALFMARLEVELEPVPATDTYRQQKFASLMEIIKTMPPEMQAVMIDIVVRSAQLPNGDEIVERIRSMTGFGPEPKDPEEREALAQQQQQEQEIQQRMTELEMMLAEGEAELAKAKAMTEAAKGKKLSEADTMHTEAKTLAELAKANAVPEEMNRKVIEAQAKLAEASARLRKEKATAEKPEPKKTTKKS